MNDVLKSVSGALNEIKALDVSGSEVLGSAERGGITTWLPHQYKEKYDRIQDLSKRKFGKLVQKMIMNALDSVKD